MRESKSKGKRCRFRWIVSERSKQAAKKTGPQAKQFGFPRVHGESKTREIKQQF